MHTNKENASNNQYIFIHASEDKNTFSGVITYRKNLIEEIKKHHKAKGNIQIQTFSSENVTSPKFKEFVKIAENSKYKIYQVSKI